MVISDLNIICLKQKEKKIYESSFFATDTYDLSRMRTYLYGDKWTILTAFKGFWHSLYPIDTETKEYDYKHGFFGIEKRIDDSSYKIILSNLQEQQLRELVNFYLTQSPIRKICILIRLDWDKSDTIIGTIGKQEFFDKLLGKKLLYNTAYIIGE